MKLLFDENLWRKLVGRLAEGFPGPAHVAEAGLLESPDREIGEFAKTGNFVTVEVLEGQLPRRALNLPGMGDDA